MSSYINRVTITGPATALDTVQEQLQDNETPFNFNAVIATWNEETAYNCSVNREPEVLRYTFDTALRPPIEVLEALAAWHPEVRIEHTWDNEVR